MVCKLRLCGTGEVAPGTMLSVDAPDAPPLAVFNVDGSFYVTSNVCTHNVAILTDGYFEGETVECPLHGGCFNVKTGEATSFPCEKPLKIYAVVRDGDDLYTEV
ncbi:MAG: non-heme iron oxygenase ferredoxin subunit [Panacagrimonas sp.]